MIAASRSWLGGMVVFLISSSCESRQLLLLRMSEPLALRNSSVGFARAFGTNGGQGWSDAANEDAGRCGTAAHNESTDHGVVSRIHESAAADVRQRGIGANVQIVNLYNADTDAIVLSTQDSRVSAG